MKKRGRIEARRCGELEGAARKVNDNDKEQLMIARGRLIREQSTWPEGDRLAQLWLGIIAAAIFLPILSALGLSFGLFGLDFQEAIVHFFSALREKLLIVGLR